METYVDAIGVDTAGTTTETAEKKQNKKLRVMVAIDESKNSFYALEWAVEHLRDVIRAEPENDQEGGLLTLVHVHPTYLQYIYPAGGTVAAAVYATDSVPEPMKKAREESTTRLFTRALEICRGKMVKTETMILEGDPKEVICQAIEETHVDLLVVGSRGLGMIKRAFLGSVSDYCAQHAKCPILIVRPPREASTSKQQ
ncbi:unnamed protein product [Microthlaspi erraticum]|uniref:UspA domain-containing protein n=1 Tax=Microthlaspi erraticum TaxID=1685480 RepID=A0A6D2KUV9_9BRAS|nr:unnamed protein product [Microthlaspi erraticum]